jgi:hypothetical protein
LAMAWSRTMSKLVALLVLATAGVVCFALGRATAIDFRTYDDVAGTVTRVDADKICISRTNKTDLCAAPRLSRNAAAFSVGDYVDAIYTVLPDGSDSPGLSWVSIVRYQR